MASNTNEKGLQTCPCCKKVFKQLSRHKCKQIPENKAGLDEKQDPDGAMTKETTPKLSKGCGKSVTLQTHTSRCRSIKSEKKDSQSSPSPRCSFEESSGSALKPIPEQSDGNGTETCPDCGKSFKCLANHKKCKMRNEKRVADNLKRAQMAENGAQNLDILEYEKTKVPSVGSLTKPCETEEEIENKIRAKDGRIGSKRLELQDLELTPERKHVERPPSIEQGKAFTGCPYCGKVFKQVQKHVRSCKKNPSYTSGATSMDENDMHFESIDQEQHKKCQLKWSERKKNILDMQDSVELSSSAVEEEYAEGLYSHQNDPRTDGYLMPRYALNTPLSMNVASLADITYSEDPKAELDRLQAGNKIHKVEISKAEKVVKEMEDHFLRKLNEKSSFKWTIFRTGSYSDETKIKSANEFDFIVSLSIKSSVKYLEDPSTLGYCLVVPNPELNAPQAISLLMNDTYLDPILVKEMAFKHFNEVILDPDFHKGRRMKRLQRDVGSPAFTFEYSAGGDNVYDIDLVPAIHFEGWPQIAAIKYWQPKWRQTHSLEELKKDYFAVARENPNAKTLPQGELLWRLSFSRTEKMLWLSADSNSSMPTCRKHILKNLKRILEDCKDGNAAMMPHLSSFHLRTFMLHQYDQRPYDNDWLEKERRTCLHICINNLIQILNSRKMSNYYVRGHNVLQNLEDEEINIFSQALMKASTKY